MAKNFKLHIKNSQLAEAINLRGLKAKLSKKKPGEEDDISLESEHESASQPHDENTSQKAKKSEASKKKQGAVGESEANAKKKQTQVQVEKEEKREAENQAPVAKSDEPVFSTLNEPQSKTTISEEKAAAPTFSALDPVKKTESAAHTENNKRYDAPSHKERVGTSAIKEEKTSEKMFDHEAPSTVHAEPKKIESVQEVKEEKIQPSMPPKKTETQSPLFLSASRNNPDQLGPVLTKKPAEAPKMTSQNRGDRDRDSRQGGEGGFQGRSQGNQSRDGQGFSRGGYSRGENNRGENVRGENYRSENSRGEYPRERRAPSDRPQSQYPYSDSQGSRSSGPERRPFERRPEGGRPLDQRRGDFRTDEGRRPGGSFSPSQPRQEGYQPRQEGYQPRQEGYQPRTGGSGPYRGPNPRMGGPGQSSGPRRYEGGFKPQPFVSRPSAPGGSGSSASALPQKGAQWDRAIPQKEGVDERSVTRRHGPVEGEKAKVRESKETKTTFKKGEDRGFDSRMRHGFQADDDDGQTWRKRRPSKSNARGSYETQEIIRPTRIKVRLPVSVKDLAQEMKLKASQLISKLFLQGIVVTLNDLLDDETLIQVLGHDFGCEIGIDTSEQERLKLSEKSIRDEIAAEPQDKLIARPPIVAFMGHVDHGKTSLIDAIRKTNRAQGEVGAITQHIGAFSCTTSHGPITILDTPGHEAFSAMRERGAGVTDIIILVVAGDEGMKEQTVEALKQAKAAASTIIVAINKCDKPNFDQERVYRQLAENNLLPESWGGQTVTVNCSAITGEGIQDLLEMIGIQSEILELKANPESRARGSVVESEMHKGLGPVATVLIQNGSLKMGDCLVFDYNWAKVKSMRDENGKEVAVAPPSTPVRINGLSGFPDAGEEFVVVGSEKEAREIAEARQEGRRQLAFQIKKKFSLENMAEKAGMQKKTLNLILRADVQGSLEALKTALLKIESKKVDVNIVFMGVGEISESDVQLANASKSIIIGFHTQIESHAEPMMKEMGVEARLHSIIYHAQDDVRDLMKGLLDKIAQETDKGKAEVKATFKSSQLGIIAGCQVIDGSITRNCMIRIMRGGNLIWKGSISSLKRFKDDVREVSKGTECGIVLHGFSDFAVGDVLEAYEITYLTQEL